MSRVQQSEGPQDAAMDQHTDAGIDHSQSGRSEKPNLDIHRVGCDKEERPTHGGGEKGQAPPTPEDHAEQDESWDHGSSLPHREAYALSPRQSAAESRESRQVRASPSGADEEGGGWRWNRAKSKWPGQVGRWRGRRRRSRGVHGSSDLGRCTERQANSMRARGRSVAALAGEVPEQRVIYPIELRREDGRAGAGDVPGAPRRVVRTRRARLG